MQVAVVGRGKLGGALGLAARSAGHEVTLLRRPDAAETPGAALPERAMDADLRWEGFDLVLLAFEKKATTVAELEQDMALAELRRIPARVKIASVVMSPAPEIVDDFLAGREIAHFLTTPAARLPGAIALLPRTSPDASDLKRALPDLHWIDADASEYRRLAVLMVGSAIAAAALGHVGRLLAGTPAQGEADYLQHVLDDAKRLLRLNGGDGFRAFASVATSGGFTESLHNQVFSRRWPLED